MSLLFALNNLNILLQKSGAWKVRYFDQRDLPSVETLRPLVAPSLRSGRYSPGPFGFLQTVDPLVSVSNYYIVVESSSTEAFAATSYYALDSCCIHTHAVVPTPLH